MLIRRNKIRARCLGILPLLSLAVITLSLTLLAICAGELYGENCPPGDVVDCKRAVTNGGAQNGLVPFAGGLLGWIAAGFVSGAPNVQRPKEDKKKTACEEARSRYSQYDGRVSAVVSNFQQRNQQPLDDLKSIDAQRHDLINEATDQVHDIQQYRTALAGTVAFILTYAKILPLLVDKFGKKVSDALDIWQDVVKSHPYQTYQQTMPVWAKQKEAHAQYLANLLLVRKNQYVQTASRYNSLVESRKSLVAKVSADINSTNSALRGMFDEHWNDYNTLLGCGDTGISLPGAAETVTPDLTDKAAPLWLKVESWVTTGYWPDVSP